MAPVKVLASRWIPRSRARPAGRWWGLIAFLVLCGADVQAQPAPEYQIKAVFLFNFAQFVEWPPHAFSNAQAPLVIGVLGDDPFGNYLEETVRGEAVNNHPMVVRRYRHVEAIEACHMLFISPSEAHRIDQILTHLNSRNILTVGDTARFIEQGGMIRFVAEESKIRLHINVEAARDAGLTISSKLLRLAHIVTPGAD